MINTSSKFATCKRRDCSHLMSSSTQLPAQSVKSHFTESWQSFTSAFSQNLEQWIPSLSKNGCKRNCVTFIRMQAYIQLKWEFASFHYVQHSLFPVPRVNILLLCDFQLARFLLYWHKSTNLLIWQIKVAEFDPEQWFSVLSKCGY